MSGGCAGGADDTESPSIDSRGVNVQVNQSEARDCDADLVVIGIFEGEDTVPPITGAPGADDVKAGFKKTALLHPGSPERLLAIGLGSRDDLTPERARVAAAIASGRAKALGAGSIAWVVPDSGEPDAIASALVEGTILATFDTGTLKSADDDGTDDGSPATLVLLGPDSLGDAAASARIAAEAQNRTRELQNAPSNLMTPTRLAERAEEIAATHESVTAEIFGPAEIASRGFGGLEAVTKGSEEEPRLMVLRYEGGDGAPLGLVGKAVTFDTGGISLKPGASMHEMKYDMSGGAAVLEAVAALAELEAPVNVIAVVPSTENMPSGTAVKPGDVITQYGGKTVEINNTDAEGRLILADALVYCIELGATRVVDIATLTGAVVIALGSSYAGLVSNDDDLAAAVEKAGTDTGELAWRLPLHDEYTEMMKGKVADLSNLASKRKAGTITAAAFLAEFVGDTPWAHIDIAGTAWDVGREYTGSGPSGFGTRLLTELALTLR